MRKAIVILGILAIVALIAGCAVQTGVPEGSDDTTPAMDDAAQDSSVNDEINQVVVDDSELDMGDLY